MNFLILILLMSVYALLQFANGSMTTIYNAARERRIPAKTQILEPIARISLMIVAAKWLEMSAVLLSTIYILSSGVAALYQSRRINDYLDFSQSKVSNTADILEKELSEFAQPFILWGIFAAIYQISDRYLLKYFTNTSTVGEYGFLYQLGYGPIILATNVLVNYISPIVYTRMGNGNDSEQFNNAKKMAIMLGFFIVGLTTIIAVITYVFHKDILMLIASEKYTPNSHLLPLIVLSAGIFSASQVWAINILGNLKPKKIRNVKIYTAMIGVLLNIIGAKYFGIDGVVFAGLTYSVLHFIGIKRQSGHTP